MASERCLGVEGLSGGYGRIPVLHDIGFDVGEGEIVGILGHNGMGKSTLLKTLMGFLPSSAGSVRYFGAAITRWPPHRRARQGIGYVPQGRGIFPGLSVRENMRFAWREDDGEDAGMTALITGFPALEPLLDRPGNTLSGGEQQLLALARCLMNDPELLLLDEPTEGIQPSIVDDIARMLTELREARSLSILLVEQNLDFVTTLTDRVLVLERGRIVEAPAGGPARYLGFGAAAGTAVPPAAPVKPPARPSLPPGAAPARPTTRPDRPPAASAAPLQGTGMTVQPPDLSRMRTMAERFGMRLSDAELDDYREIMAPYVEAYARIDAAPDNLPQVLYPRAPGYRPAPADNPLNAWYYRTEVKGAPGGPLRGRTIVLKDNVCLAGVPMMNGSSIMEGYTPEIDATIVTRILEAGGTIIGKAHCENFCLSGGSHTCAAGPVHNPWKQGHMAGGSSSGSAALVAAGEADMAIAGDQGGSIRIPAANCGVYGMKPTHGLVPYTGIMPIEHTIDHVGPVTANVADNALFLEVLAGADGLDPRQYAPEVHRYTQALNRGCSRLKIGLLKEGFNRPESEADVDAKVREMAERLRGLGADLQEISIPAHGFALDLWTAITVEGLQELMMRGNGFGTNHRGQFLPSMSDRVAAWRQRADELSPSLKVCMFLGEYFHEAYRGRYYGKAQNLMRRAAQDYLDALHTVDLLAMPTVPMKAQPIPPADSPLSIIIQRAFEMVGNTAPFNAAGLPAMSIPCGLSDGLPVGMMLVAPKYAEMTIYQAAHAAEQGTDWRTL